MDKDLGGYRHRGWLVLGLTALFTLDPYLGTPSSMVWQYDRIYVTWQSRGVDVTWQMRRVIALEAALLYKPLNITFQDQEHHFSQCLEITLDPAEICIRYICAYCPRFHRTSKICYIHGKSHQAINETY